MDTFGQRLKSLRTSRRLTQKQVAEAIGTDEKTITKYEHDSRIPSHQSTGTINLRKLAELFGVYPEWLLTGKGYMNKEQELRERAKVEERIQIAAQYVEKYQHKYRIEKEISKLYDIENIPKLKGRLANTSVYDIDFSSLSDDEWDELISAAQARVDMMNSIFNYIEIETGKFKERYGE